MDSAVFDPYAGLFRLGLTCVLVGVVLLLSYVKRLGLGKEFVVSIARGFAQLMLFALLLTYIFTMPEWYLPVMALIAAMVLMAGYTSAKRATGMERAASITTPSIVVGAATALTVMALTGIMPMQPQFIIPLSGMAFGNAMKVCSLTLNRLMGEIRNNREKIEAALALGATAEQAIEPYTRISVHSALIPSMDSLKTLGVIFIPGAMAGLLMAGAPPLAAAEYQIAIFLMIVSTGTITSIASTYLARKRLFTEAHQLVEVTG